MLLWFAGSQRVRGADDYPLRMALSAVLNITYRPCGGFEKQYNGRINSNGLDLVKTL
jgi:hypothetical protein